MTRLPLAAVCAGIALAPSPAALAEPLAAVTVTGKGVLTICRNWILFRTCKPYDKIDLPPRIAVGDRLDLSFGSSPKDYLFHVVEIRQKGEGCLLLSNISNGHEDRERIEVPRCEPVAKPGRRAAIGSRYPPPRQIEPGCGMIGGSGRERRLIRHYRRDVGGFRFAYRPGDRRSRLIPQRFILQRRA